MTSRIPERCATCPWLKSDEKVVEVLELKQDTIIRKTTSDELEDIAGEVAELLQDAPQELVDALGQPPSAEQVAVIMRMVGGHALAKVTHHLEKVQHDMETMSSWCEGPIELTTTRKGVVYSIGVCASDFLLDEDTGGYERAAVRRHEIID